ncbi:right-handed parallel beta-helix repeat-containing protein [Kribbella steppae]|uniref:right-handed parallel beta-helix repeat-containing protein n=1 Tax=Kribbella steppae TaxID=2512223 RepID=UPI0018EE78D2|nr:right-handed parallel beta-helix repeat-containing protein [Kribbella steppae]
MWPQRSLAVGLALGVGLVIGAGSALGVTPEKEAADCPSFWVAPDGDDKAPGTKSKPWRTVEQARDTIRARGLNRQLSCDLVVNLKAGTYQVAKTIGFDDRDSGSNGHQVVYRSADGPGKAVLEAAQEVTGWTPYKDGIFKAKVDIDQPFYTLYVDGERATTARYPNRRSDVEWAPYLESVLIEPEKEAVRDQVGYTDGDWNETWNLNSYTDWPAQLMIWSGGSWSWFTDTVPIKNADWKDNKVILDYWTRYAMINSRAGSRYFVQNSLDLLDAEDEYYLDWATKELYYKPRGGTMDGKRVLRPTQTEVLSLAGASPTRRLQDIAFEGLGITSTDFMQWYRSGWISAGDSGQKHKYPEYDRQIEMTRNRFGAVTLTNTRNIGLSGLHLRDTGYHGVYLNAANDHVKISDSLLENIGADGIKVEGGYPGEGDVAHHNTFTNLYIDHIGELVPGDAAGLELMDTSNNEISHIVVKHSARYGISLEARPEVKDGEGYALNNNFSYIRLEETGLDSGDMGAFYTYGVDNQEPHPIQNTVKQMVITDVIPDASMPDSGTRGVHMDAGGCGFSFADIEVGQVTDDKYQSYQCNQVTNANWAEGFDASKMEYDKIGVLPTFPYDVAGR